MKIMKLKLMPNGVEKWIPCKRKDLKEKDQFYEVTNGVKSSVKVALSDAIRVPNPANNNQQMWIVNDMPWPDVINVMDALGIEIKRDNLPEYCWD
jgi:hypothetical protein